jgi:hypothetical protein
MQQIDNPSIIVRRKILRLGPGETHLKMKDFPVLTWPRRMFSEVCSEGRTWGAATQN